MRIFVTDHNRKSRCDLKKFYYYFQLGWEIDRKNNWYSISRFMKSIFVLFLLQLALHVKWDLTFFHADTCCLRNAQQISINCMTQNAGNCYWFIHSLLSISRQKQELHSIFSKLSFQFELRPFFLFFFYCRNSKTQPSLSCDKLDPWKIVCCISDTSLKWYKK